ncbi:MAG: 5-(carboxyamino)imidazole ribonucleotide synthase [Micrococcales bacterium]|nr:MAG: 5-(carboxyamino)imidazole ribonucleotide synthase [Micrococcales bacterium]PIE27437.1 MAG: 5-(carboxyamino)imidazole ribonucleotide synthase [Micrococcales bacterium]
MASPAAAPTVVVVGGGQLARMMAPAAVALGVGLRVVAQSRQDSAALAIPDVVVSEHTDLAGVCAAAEGAAVLTFDHEHVPMPVLAAVAQAGVAVRPAASALRHAQDKIVMRRRLAGGSIGQPRWQVVTDPGEISAFAEQAGWPVVVKTPRGGYDGKGVRVVDETSLQQVQSWWADSPDGLLVEERVDFVRELAVLVARSPSGQAAAWPVVQTMQRDGICDTVIAPAPELDDELAGIATQTGLRIADQIGVTGVLAVEGFQTADGRFLVNELAMRPHNSGHWTIDAAVTSQFEQHLRAVLDLPLGDPRPRARWAVMCNILGGQHPDLYRSYLHVMARDPALKAHLYAKAVRPGRKVGHVTAYGADLDDVQARARHAADFIMGVIDE